MIPLPETHPGGSAVAAPGGETILHVDMDAFFVSVELVERPELRGRPVVVGGRRDARGVVASASYEARQFGVRSAMPLRTAARLCPQAVFLEPRFELYEAYSERLGAIFDRYTPAVEWASIDEAWLDLTGTARLHGPPLAVAGRLQKEIQEQTGLPCSMGLARTRLIAKIASEQAKPHGLLWIPAGAEASFLAPLPVRRLPGVGPSGEAALAAYGITTIGQLQQLPPGWLEQVFGSWGAVLARRAWGEDGGWSGEQEGPQSVSHHHTFATDVADPEAILAALSLLVQRAASRLRQLGLFARTITLVLRTARFETHGYRRTLREPTQLDAVLMEAAGSLLERGWTGEPLRLVGIELSGLTRGGRQLNLLEAVRQARLERLLAAADRIRQRYGFRSLLLARALPAGRRKAPRPPRS